MHGMARPIRVAAAGDIHCSPETQDRLAAAFERVEAEVDLFLLAGDLTTLGEAEQALALADICAAVEPRVVAVLGNHDWHANRVGEIVETLEQAGVTMLNPGTTTCDVDGTSVGVVGTKGFVGGFPDSQLPDFGEPILRQVYRDTTAEVEAIDAGLQEIAACDHRIVLLHYAPTTTTLEGEPRVIWAFLGTDRMAPPIGERRPDIVLHGHAHRGTFEGRIGEVPVYNVALEVMQRDFFVFELGANGLRTISRPAVEGELHRPSG
jgi:Icc-related predicted phosphoesterase